MHLFFNNEMFDNYKIRTALGAHKASDQNLLWKYLISVLIIDCRYYKNFTFQLEHDRRTVETSLFFNVTFYSEIRSIVGI